MKISPNTITSKIIFVDFSSDVVQSLKKLMNNILSDLVRIDLVNHICAFTNFF